MARRWTDEENQRLLQMLVENSRDNGNVVHGFYLRAAKEFGRNSEGIRRHANYLMADGKLPYSTERTNYLPLVLTDAEASWLAGILDGEGTIPTLRYKHGSRVYKSNSLPCNSIRVTVVHNTDAGVIDKTVRLLPFGKLSEPYKKGLAVKFLRRVDVYGSRNTYVTLKRLLPYMAETNKIQRAQEILQLIESRLISVDPWLMTPLEA